MNARAVVEANLRRVRERIAAACARAGRPPDDVTLVVVTKSVGPEIAALLPELGVRDLGESRPQALWAKAAALSPAVRWHLVGHLQRNKVDRTLPLVYLTHSVDSLRLLDAIESEAERLGRVADVLVEVNVSGEAAKAGFGPSELPAVGERAAQLRHVRVHGLMTMAPLSHDPEDARPTFTGLRELRDGLRREFASPHRLEHLSMGMTGDFEVAIEEGATMVRIGTALFEGLPP
jgi:pyridoxal phosphate enzyme (YggS family)